MVYGVLRKLRSNIRDGMYYEEAYAELYKKAAASFNSLSDKMTAVGLNWEELRDVQENYTNLENFACRYERSPRQIVGLIKKRRWLKQYRKSDEYRQIHARMEAHEAELAEP